MNHRIDVPAILDIIPLARLASHQGSSSFGERKTTKPVPRQKDHKHEDRESDRTGWTHLVEQGIIMLEAPPVPLPSACLLVRTPRRSRSRRWHLSLIWALLLWVCLGSRWRLLRVGRQNAVVLRKAGHEEVLRRGLGGPLAHPRSLWRSGSGSRSWLPRFASSQLGTMDSRVCLFKFQEFPHPALDKISDDRKSCPRKQGNR